jgi:predicted dinucleotide-binding enzyme
MDTLLEETGGLASAQPVGEALSFGEIILLATPWSVVPEIVTASAGALDGKIVIDATNNFGGPVINNLAALHAGAPKARVYRAFNSLGWEVFARPEFGAEQADLFFCGSDGENRVVVESLIADIGLRPIWIGDLDRVGLVDNLGALWVTLAFRQGLGRRLALRALTE